MGDLTNDILAHALAQPSEEARAVMRLSLLDWLACGIAGAAEPVARITRDMVLSEGGSPQAALFGGGHAPARGAALVNGATSHALDYDDTHFAHIGHPSVAILPAALALGEGQGATVGQLVDAALAGCEASIRFGLALGRPHYQVGFHQTATAGALGATVAAAQILGLDETRRAHALGLASTRAAGLKSQFGTMGKPYNAGIAAATGVEAARLAAAGFISNPDGIDGPLGLIVTHHGEPAPQPEGWLMASVSHKFHACCHGLHATLEALAQLKPIDPATVSRVEIATNPRWLTVCDKPAPATGLEAKFSYRAVTAFALLGHDTAALATFSDRLCADPQVISLSDVTRVTSDDTIAETAARVTVTTDAGTRSASFDLDTPLPLAERSARVEAKAAVLVGPDRAAALATAIRDDAAPLSALTTQI